MTQKAVGRRLPRHDATLQVTGRSRYAADMVRPGMLFAAVLRSRYPHARIVAIDTRPALAAPGVRAVVTAADVPFNRFGFTHLDQPVLAEERVRYLGDPVAAVAADSEETAREALEGIRVDYEPLPAVFDPAEALSAGAPLLHGDTNLAAHIKIRSGDIEEGWRQADTIVEETFTTPVVEHAALEPHAMLAEVTADGELRVWSSVQRPYLVASDLARVLRWPEHRLRVLTPAIGGGFGGKNEMTAEAIVALLALKTARPVKLIFDRREEFTATTVRHAYRMTLRSGVRRDGVLTARRVEILCDAGAYVSWGESTLAKAAIHAAGPYRIPHVVVDAYLVYTNNNVGGAMRGFGVPQLGFAYEVHTDTIAHHLGMDPVAFRLRNLLSDGDVLPTGQQLGRVTLREAVARATRLSGWGGTPT
jgi:CO/xanthine dehydrogenase Mo-binding subunit